MRFFVCFMLAFAVSLPLRVAAADASAPRPADGNRIEERFRSMDADNTGSISFEEFRKRYPNMQRPAFDAIDADRDGAISLEEWRTFSLGHGMGSAMPPGRMPPPGHGADGRTPPPGHGGGQGGRPLILPPAR